MQYDYSYSSGGGIFTGIWVLIWLVLAILAIVGLWKTLSKAGLPGWAAIIPFYNEYNVVKMSNRPLWFFWAMLGCSLFAWIPLLGFLLIIGIIVLWVFIALDIAANFGKGTGFAVLLIIFPSIMFIILGFGDAQYNRVAAPGSAGFGTTPPPPAGGGYAAVPPAPTGYAAPPAPPAPPAAPVTPSTPPQTAAAPVTPSVPVTPTPSAPVTPPPSAPVTPADTTPAQPATADTPDAATEEPPTPPTPPAPPAGSPPPPPPLS